ncbi:MAG: hypothetical protein AAF715_21190 [Myxococcota bacterium]
MASDLACELARRRALVTGDRPFAVIVDDDDDERGVDGERAQAAASGASAASPVNGGGGGAREVATRAVLHAVDARAARYGVRPGQRAADAAALVGGLHIVHLGRGAIEAALGRIAEHALALAPTVSVEGARRRERREGPATGRRRRTRDEARRRDEVASGRYPSGLGAGPYDTVWIDATGCTQRMGGEDVFVAELHALLAPLEHRLRIALADGPWIAQAIARWHVLGQKNHEHRTAGAIIVPSGATMAHLDPLPVAALPLGPEPLGWLGKLGILRLEDLRRLDRAQLAVRLRPRRASSGRARRRGGDGIAPAIEAVLELIAGRDATPLTPYVPPRGIEEHAAFDTELSGTEPLLFVLRGLTARAVGRLHNRGEACGRSELTLTFDAGYLAPELSPERDVIDDELDAEDRRVHAPAEAAPCPLEIDTSVTPPRTTIVVAFPVPLADEAELRQAWASRLERLELPAPVRSITLTLDGLSPQRHDQLDLHRRRQRDPRALPTLLAELSAWLGSDRVGILEAVPVHRPELRSRLVSASEAATSSSSSSAAPEAAPARLSATAGPPKAAERLSTLESEPTRMLPVPHPLHDPETPSSSSPWPLTLVRLRFAHRLDAIEWWQPAPLHRDYSRATLRTPTAAAPSSRGGDASHHHVEALVFTTPDAPDHLQLHAWFD